MKSHERINDWIIRQTPHIRLALQKEFNKWGPIIKDRLGHKLLSELPLCNGLTEFKAELPKGFSIEKFRVIYPDEEEGIGHKCFYNEQDDEVICPTAGQFINRFTEDPAGTRLQILSELAADLLLPSSDPQIAYLVGKRREINDRTELAYLLPDENPGDL